MISDEMKKYLSWIFIAGDRLSFTLCTPFLWNTRRNKLELSYGLQFFFYKMVGVIMALISVIISIRIFRAMFLDEFDMFGLLFAACYLCILSVISCLMRLMCKKRGEIADLVNGVTKLDSLLKRVFPGAFIFGQKYLKKTMVHFEHVLRLIFWFHCTLAWLFSVAFYMRFDVFHRFFVEYLGITPKWDEFMFFPIAMGEAWFAYMVGYTTAVTISVFAWPLTGELWFDSLTHVVNAQQYSRRIPCFLQGQAYLRFLRCQQLVAELCFDCSASLLVTLHHLSLLIALILGNVFVLNNGSGEPADLLLMQGIVVVGIPLGYLITYYETLYLDRFTTAADNFYKACRFHFGTSAYLKRGFRSCRSIRVWTGYPFFCIESKHFFVMFVKLIVDQTITLLLVLRR